MDLRLILNTLNKAFVSLILLCLLPQQMWGHNYGYHNDELRRILFGDKGYYLSKESDDRFKLLCEAVWLTVDLSTQEGQGKERLEHMKKFGVSYVPDYNEIKSAGSGSHERYTHMGWEKGFKQFESNPGAWDKRKKLLLSFVDKLCKFKRSENIKKDAFAALCYDIHILGDHIGNKEGTRWDRIQVAYEIDHKNKFPSPNDGPIAYDTLVEYIAYHVQRLFREQKGTPAYDQLMSLLRSDMVIASNDNGETLSYDDVKYHAWNVRQALETYIPSLMENEQFFQRAFF